MQLNLMISIDDSLKLVSEGVTDNNDLGLN